MRYATCQRSAYRIFIAPVAPPPAPSPAELESLASGVPAAELDRAKRRTAAVICNALESKETSAEDLGRQVRAGGAC